MGEIGVSGAQCGLCCNKPLACASCVDATLRSNGLSPEKYRERIAGLSHTNRSSFEPWAYSEMCLELNRIIREETTQHDYKEGDK